MTTTEHHNEITTTTTNEKGTQPMIDFEADYCKATDVLKYAAAILRERTDWTTDAIGGSECDEDHETELDAIDAIGKEITSLAAQFGDLHHYSDGRRVKSSKEIQLGLTTSHVWHYDPQQEERRSWRGNLPSGDPDVPSPGIYEVTIDPECQEIHVRVARLVPAGEVF
jgi:hypothetical protein